MVMRLVPAAIVAAATLVAPPILANQPSPESAALKTVTDEFLRARAGSGDPAGLPLARVREQAAQARGVLARLQAIDTAKLSHDDWITHALLTFDAGLMRDAERFYWMDFRVTPYTSPLGRGLTARFEAMPVATAEDRLAYIDALHQLANAMTSHEMRLRSQMARGVVLPVEELRLVVPFVRATVEDPASSGFAISPQRLEKVPAAERASFRAAVDEAIATAIVPAVNRLVAFLDGPYRAKAPAHVGVSHYPGGLEYYAHLITRHTTLSLTPEEIHQRGLDEVSRLERELDEARKAAGFNGTLAEFRTFLKTDRRFFARTADEFGALMMKAIARIEPRIDAYFLRRPKAPYGVLRLEPALEPSMTYGYYQIPSPLEASGFYRYNGSQLDKRSVLNAAALIYHELIPGHHFQLLLVAENDRLPAVRRGARYTPFNEGWGEYASDLAGEMGMYADPYDRAGRLAMDLFLSTRLVVDTGMNALGWSREKAMDFMRTHTLESEVQIDTETLRYSVDMPGQALAYKLGAMKIHELRKRAADALGSRFDIRRFHDYMLDAGAMPLPVLEAHVACFIKEVHAR
jgi:uncharacterized protein (DUF885 family)